MDKKQRELQRRQEDAALNQALLWVAGAVILELLFIFVDRYYFNYTTELATQQRALMIQSALGYARIGGAVVAAAGLCWFLFTFAKRGRALRLPAALPLVGAVVALSAHIALAFQEPGVQMLLMLIPAWGGLALVYYLYQREFFFSALASGLSVVALWMIRSGPGRLTTLVFVGGVAVLLALGTVLLGAARKHGGEVKVLGHTVQLMSKDAQYLPIALSALISIAAIAAAFLLGGMVSYYLIYGLIAWIFALLVYHTVKMM